MHFSGISCNSFETKFYYIFSIADIADRISPGTGGMKSELEISVSEH